MDYSPNLRIFPGENNVEGKERVLDDNEFDRSLSDRAFDLSAIITELVRNQLSTILSPIQTLIDTFLENVQTVVLNFYYSGNSSNVLLTLVTGVTNSIVTQVVAYIAEFQTFIDDSIAGIIYGNSTSSQS